MEIHQKKPTCNVFLKRFAVCGCFVFNKERNKGKKQMNKNKTKQGPVSLGFTYKKKIRNGRQFSADPPIATNETNLLTSDLPLK